MARIFIYNGQEFPDPDPAMSLEEVQSHLASFYAEIGNSRVETQEREGDTLHYFRRNAGTKG